MVARKVSLQHKVLLGYMILIMAVCGMVSILLYERSRMREIKTETSEIRRIRHDISTAHRYITELATYGESVIVWEDTDFREYRRKRLQTDSLLQILKVSCGTFVLPKQIDSLCHLLEAKEIHLLRIMETITRQGKRTACSQIVCLLLSGKRFVPGQSPKRKRDCRLVRREKERTGLRAIERTARFE